MFLIKNLKVAKKLWLIVLPSMIALVLLLVFFIYRSNSIETESKKALYDETYTCSVNILNADRDFYQAAIAQQEAGLTQNLTASKKDELQKDFEENAQQVQDRVSTAMRETLYLFNIVPQSIVNQTLNEYSRNIVLLSLSVIILTIVIFAVFFEMYSRSSRKYDAALHSREHLFDLLVSQTRNAFMLLEEGGERPAYLSSNLRDILQEDILRFQKDGAGYRLIGSAPAGDSRVLEEINRALSGWDGRQEFVSGYLPCACIGGPGTEYVRLSLSPALSRPGEFIGIIQDVTPEYRRENSLREALTLADSANRAKTQFLSSVSHDIRTPLNAIINMQE